MSSVIKLLRHYDCHKGYKSKRRQIQNGDNQNCDNQNGDTSKTATHPTRRQPRRRQPKRCMSVAVLACRRFGYNQNGDKSKTATIQLIQNAVLTCIQNGEKKLRVAVLDLSPFWRVAVLNTTKTATNPKRRHVKTATIQLYLFTKLIPIQDGDIPKRCLSPILRVAVLDLSPLWRVAVFGDNQNGHKSKTATILLFYVEIFDKENYSSYMWRFVQYCSSFLI